MDRILIYRVGYVVAFLLISLPVSAYYHGHTSGGMVLVGFLLMLILIPLAKVLFYLFMALITNKWTWIIGVGLLFLFVIAGIASNSKEPSSNTSTPPYQGSTPSNMVVPQKKQRTEIYTEVCSLCNGKGKVTCSHCGGNRRIESVCSLCKGSGGKMTITCPDCGGSGSADGFWQCMKCNGKGRINVVCNLCNGTGKEVTYCHYCDAFTSFSNCSACGGKGRVTRTKVVEYYE